MNKTKLLIFALLALTLTGCVKPEQGLESTSGLFHEGITTTEYNGHRYILYKGYERGGITHDPDCPCHEKGDDCSPDLLINQKDNEN